MLVELFEKVLHGYNAARAEPFSGHPFQKVLRTDLPAAIETRLALDDRYLVRGSPGLTQWTHVPWTAVMDVLITDSPQRGYYPTFLFKADMSGFYLTLNQGITDIRESYKSAAAEVLRVRAQDYVARIGKAPEGFQTGEISLLAPKGSDPSFYDYGSIVAKFYARDLLPTDEIIVRDLRTILSIYSELVEGDDSDSPEDNLIAKSENLYEDSKKWRYHRRIDRNTNLAKLAKQYHGYKCVVCNFDFETVYGELGKKFIEAHHLTPISKLEGKVALDPKTDFTVLCANCHRMIHRQDDPSDLFGLKILIKR